MSGEEFTSSRPLSVAIPQGPYCPRRPTLADILSNSAPPPWTLSAFTAYLSQNHCLETLEFTMDASRYRKHYNKMVTRTMDMAVPANSEECEYVRMLWQRLLEAYIIPNGPREVNLPSNVRDRLLSLPNDFNPPPPDSLESAVKIIYELMDESVLVSFLNSVSRQRGTQSCNSSFTGSFESIYLRGTLDDRALVRSRSRRDAVASPSGAGFSSSSYSPSSSSGAYQSKSLGSSNLSSAISREGRNSQSGDSLTDDSGSASSPGHEPMTPPSTPPTSDVGGTSPKQRSDGTWKKVAGKLAWKKKSGGALRENQYPVVEDEPYY
ncbi:MAG: hypothetical protein M1827_002968 [Pycnora praestabilis]|nr:MAG: hypothetical protein M1827_002968 [Pycnora praestabilis]